MTSVSKLLAAIQRSEENRIFNALPRQVRDALNNAPRQPCRPSVARDALLRGVSIEKLVETISRKPEEPSQ